MTFAFEKLLVYQKSVDFADNVCSATEQFQSGYGFLVDQLNRAALSISPNIAQGNRGCTKADRKNFFGIARGSVQECLPQFELARRRGLIDDSKHAALKSRLEAISRMLSGLITGLEKGIDCCADLANDPHISVLDGIGAESSFCAILDNVCGCR